MFKAKIQLKIKFRFIIDWMKLEKYFDIQFDPNGGIKFSIADSMEVPVTAKTLYNDRGVTLRIW